MTLVPITPAPAPAKQETSQKGVLASSSQWPTPYLVARAQLQHQRGTGRGSHLSATGQPQTIPHSGRSMGIYAPGSKGHGKSRLMGRVTTFQDYISGIPQVIFDPVGGTIDNFLDKMVRFLQHIPKEFHHHYWRRIVYVDVSGQEGFGVPCPIYYRLGNETLREVAERYPQLLLMSNPSLAEASVQGWAPLHRISVYSGMVLYALGLPITEAVNLLRRPEAWIDRFHWAQERFPEVSPAVSFFTQEYIPMRQSARERLTNTFLDRLFPLTLDPRLQALYGAAQPGIVWGEVERQIQTVLLDFRNVLDPEIKRFSLLWWFSYLFEYIKRRGRSETPLAVVIDELAAMTNSQTVGLGGVNPLANLFDELINVYMRNANIWLTAAHQELFQLDERLRNTLLSLGTYIIGRQSTMQACRVIADHMFLTDPMKVKHHRKVWGNADPRSGAYFVIDHEPEFMPLVEQVEVFAQRIKKLRLMNFLLRPAEGEGAVSHSVIPISIASVDRGKETGEWLFPNQPVLSRLRPLLAQASGKPIAALLAPKPDSALPPQTTRKVQLSGVTGYECYSKMAPP